MGMHPLGHQRAGPRKAVRLDLAPPAGLIRAAHCEARAEVGDIRIAFPGPPIATLIEREGLGPYPGAHRLGVEATRCSNLTERLALGKAGLDLLIAVHPCGVPGILLLLEPWRLPLTRQRTCRHGRLRYLRRGGQRRGRLTGQDTAQRRGDPLEIPCEHVAQITEQVKAISDLHRCWRTLCDASGIVRRAITRNNFHSWMVTQPCRDRLGSTLWQEVDRSMLFEIHEDRAIDPALAEGNIINAQDLRRGLDKHWSTAEDPEDCIATERHPQARGHPCTGFAPCVTSEHADRLSESPSALGVAGGERRQAFDKGPTWTRGGGTAEPPDL